MPEGLGISQALLEEASGSRVRDDSVNAGEDTFFAAGILATALVRNGAPDEKRGHLLWRRLRARMAKEISQVRQEGKMADTDDALKRDLEGLFQRIKDAGYREGQEATLRDIIQIAQSRLGTEATSPGTNGRAAPQPAAPSEPAPGPAAGPGAPQAASAVIVDEPVLLTESDEHFGRDKGTPQRSRFWLLFL